MRVVYRVRAQGWSGREVEVREFEAVAEEPSAAYLRVFRLPNGNLKHIPKWDVARPSEARAIVAERGGEDDSGARGDVGRGASESGHQ